MSKCPLHKYCPIHNFIHGAEAEELREKFELLAETLEAKDDEAVDADMLALDIRHILNDVDARDSAAYAEMEGKKVKKAKTKKKRSRKKRDTDA